MTTENFCFYLQTRQIQTSQTGGQRYNDTTPLVFPAITFATNFVAKKEKKSRARFVTRAPSPPVCFTEVSHQVVVGNFPSFVIFFLSRNVRNFCCLWTHRR